MRPCLAPNAKNSSEKGRARPRSLDSRRRRGRQTLPTDALAHRDSPCAGPRSLPSSHVGLDRVCIAIQKTSGNRHEVGDLGRRAAMIKKKTMWIKAPAQGFPAMPVAPRRALPISRAGGRPKGGGRGRH